MGTAIKHPVPDWVKPSFVIFDAQSTVPGCKKITNGTGCFIAVPTWQQRSSKGYTCTQRERVIDRCLWYISAVCWFAVQAAELRLSSSDWSADGWVSAQQWNHMAQESPCKFYWLANVIGWDCYVYFQWSRRL